MLEILLAILAGLLIGIIFGLVPGLHPNTIVLLIPFIAQFGLQPLVIIAFVVSLGISNTFVDFIPSMLLGAPEGGNEHAVTPAHRMLLQGNGSDAVKLALIGGLGSIILVLALLPAIIFSVPRIYELSLPFTYALLIFIVLVMILHEKTNRKRATALLCFFLAGLTGLSLQYMPIDRNIVLFPVLSGLFGVSALSFSKKGTKVPARRKQIHVTGRQQRRSVLFGSAGGIASGLLPGVGSSELATLASADKNEKSFLMTLGAITISNTLLSIMALWLIGKSRSGIASALEQLVQIGFSEVIFIAATALTVASISSLITLKLAKKSLGLIENIDYSKISKAIIAFIILMTVIFSGIYGLLLLGTCTALGIFAGLAGIRRGVLMGVLILPTIIFYLPF